MTKDSPQYRIIPCTEEDVAYIEAAQRLSDDAYAPPSADIEGDRLVLRVNNGDRIIAGCVLAVDTWGVAAIDAVWVDKPYRRRGIGTALVSAAEREASQRGCYLVLVGVFDFHASAFFERLGYDVFNIWEDFPTGHDNYTLAKRLELAAPAKTTPAWITAGQAEDGDYIEGLLADYNAVRVPQLHTDACFDTKVVDAEGRLLGGIAVGNSGWNVAHIDLLWVEPSCRRKGLGTALLCEAERAAKADGAYLMLLGAYDWQVDFFVRRGYVVTGTLADCPRGHTYYALAKRLGPH